MAILGLDRTFKQGKSYLQTCVKSLLQRNYKFIEVLLNHDALKQKRPLSPCKYYTLWKGAIKKKKMVKGSFQNP